MARRRSRRASPTGPRPNPLSPKPPAYGPANPPSTGYKPATPSGSAGDTGAVTAEDGTTFTPPPFMTYDPALDANLRATQRGLQDIQQDFKHQKRIDRQDFKQTKGDIQQEKQRGKQDIGRDAARGRLDFTQKREDIGKSAARGEQDFNVRLGNLVTNYGIKATGQMQAANAQGVADAGTLAAGAQARAENFVRDKAPLDLARERQQGDIATALTRTATDEGQFEQDISRSTTRLGQDIGRSKLLTKRDFLRARIDQRRNLNRAEREAAIAVSDTTAQEIFQARQNSPGAFNKYGTKTGSNKKKNGKA